MGCSSIIFSRLLLQFSTVLSTTPDADAWVCAFSSQFDVGLCKTNLINEIEKYPKETMRKCTGKTIDKTFMPFHHTVGSRRSNNVCKESSLKTQTFTDANTIKVFRSIYTFHCSMLIVRKEDGGMENIQIQLMQDKENVLFVLQFQKPMRRMEKKLNERRKITNGKRKSNKKKCNVRCIAKQWSAKIREPGEQDSWIYMECTWKRWIAKTGIKFYFYCKYECVIWWKRMASNSDTYTIYRCTVGKCFLISSKKNE